MNKKANDTDFKTCPVTSGQVLTVAKLFLALPVVKIVFWGRWEAMVDWFVKVTLLVNNSVESWGLFRDPKELEQSFLKVAFPMTQIHLSEFLHPGFRVSIELKLKTVRYV